MVNQKQHWENIYTTKEDTDYSWFQEYAKTSVEFLSLLQLAKDASIIDIRGGDGHFVDTLLELRYTNISVLGISGTAIDRA